MTIRTDCPCKRKDCPRHGDCEACRAHHAKSNRPRPCERKAQKEYPTPPCRWEHFVELKHEKE